MAIWEAERIPVPYSTAGGAAFFPPEIVLAGFQALLNVDFKVPLYFLSLSLLKGGEALRQ